MNNIVKIAFNKVTQEFIHIDNASNGLSCNCECLKCHEKLEAIQGQLKQKHFRHHTNNNCEGSQETALHQLSKQILIENNKIEIPGHGTLVYSNPKAEIKLETIRPDVSAFFEETPIYFEIKVTHGVDSEKEFFFITQKHRAIEIDLSDCRLSTFEEIKNLVLSENSNKKILYWGDDKTVELEIKNDSSFEKSKPLKLFEISLENILLCISMLVFYKFIKFAIK